MPDAPTYKTRQENAASYERTPCRKQNSGGGGEPSEVHLGCWFLLGVARLSELVDTI